MTNIYERKYDDGSIIYFDKDKKISISLDRTNQSFSYGTSVASSPWIFTTEPHATVRKLKNWEIIKLRLQGIIG